MTASSYQRGKRAPQRLVEHRLAAELAHHDLRRHLALAEAGHLHLARELLGGRRELLLDGGRLDLDVDAHARPVELGRGCLHGHGAHDLTRVALHRAARTPVRDDRGHRRALGQVGADVSSSASSATREKSVTSSREDASPPSSPRRSRSSVCTLTTIRSGADHCRPLVRAELGRQRDVARGLPGRHAQPEAVARRGLEPDPVALDGLGLLAARTRARGPARRCPRPGRAAGRSRRSS